MNMSRRRKMVQAGVILLEVIAISAFTTTTTTTSSYREKTAMGTKHPLEQSQITTLQMSQLAGDESEQQRQKQQQLSAQELILQESLGITPETAKERQDRLTQRQALIDSEKREKTQNAVVAALAFLAAILNYGYQFTHPITSLSLLTEMQRNSDAITVIGTNGKPTVVDFWAPWCGNCKAAAPTLASVEEEYKSRVNFVMVNGDLGENWPIIERFGVDAIPHLAMVGADGLVETALIGPIPKGVLREDLDTMLENAKQIQIATTDNNGGIENTRKKDLPFVMFDAFQNAPEKRKIAFKAEH